MRPFRFRALGPSGRGDGRQRYAVDDAETFRLLGIIEGRSGSWTNDTGRIDTVPSFATREDAARKL